MSRLNEFIFASEFLQGAKAIRMLEVEGKIDEDTILRKNSERRIIIL